MGRELIRRIMIVSSAGVLGLYYGLYYGVAVTEENPPHPKLIAAAKERFGEDAQCYMDTFSAPRFLSPRTNYYSNGNSLARAHFTCLAYQPEIFLFSRLGLGERVARAGLGFDHGFEPNVPLEFKLGTRCIFNSVRSITDNEVVFDWGDTKSGGQTIVAKDPSSGKVMFGTVTRLRSNDMTLGSLIWQFHRIYSRILVCSIAAELQATGGQP